MARALVFVWVWVAAIAPALGAKPQPAAVSATVSPTTVAPGAEAVVEVAVDVPDGLHAQSHTPTEKNYIAFTVTIDPNPAVEAREATYPKGEDKEYPLLGQLNVYTGKVVTKVP